MSLFSRTGSRRRAAAAATVAAAVVCPLTACASASAAVQNVTPPPAHAGFDYQIGTAYAPPAGVKVVTRDHQASPAPGLYNICYVNAFQAQPGAEAEWGDLLLRDASGKVVYDKNWGEAMLDIRTDAKRKQIAAKVGSWVDSCAAKGFQAVEPDNLDTFDRTKLISRDNAETFVRLLADHAHAKGLAIAQKNASALSGDRARTGLDFAVAEECGRWDECGDYVDGYGDHVIVIEYEAKGLKKACAAYGDRLSIVLRDLDVTAPGSSGYVRRTC
ncbi:endo alpha-1,4 polygalactosaminidase [Streptomyces sp. PsTaAH-124]|uniref:endo alpha-1,4 polygalactosaminidase n=1 Tax=Streptomyces sp. PsTaAH-124 TaxID=1157638 RepID=UPI000476C828|nr:endo alpha-1,4 polygalactosaminidase [Streptomyces sp. PsTaAH-124]